MQQDSVCGGRGTGECQVQCPAPSPRAAGGRARRGRKGAMKHSARAAATTTTRATLAGGCRDARCFRFRSPCSMTTGSTASSCPRSSAAGSEAASLKPPFRASHVRLPRRASAPETHSGLPSTPRTRARVVFSSREPTRPLD
eukprot:3010577-Rhodomonas_salina.3